VPLNGVVERLLERVEVGHVDVFYIDALFCQQRRSQRLFR
jgi:hypothetical protein